MNKVIIVPLVLSLFALNSCETKRFEVQTKTNFDLEFLINDKGSFEEQEIVTEKRTSWALLIYQTTPLLPTLKSQPIHVPKFA